MNITIDTLNAAEKAEYAYIRETLGTMRLGHTTRTSRKVARAILRDGWWTWDGRFNDPIVTSVGLGLYDVSVRELHPKS